MSVLPFYSYKPVDQAKDGNCFIEVDKELIGMKYNGQDNDILINDVMYWQYKYVNDCYFSSLGDLLFGDKYALLINYY